MKLLKPNQYISNHPWHTGCSIHKTKNIFTFLLSIFLIMEVALFAGFSDGAKHDLHKYFEKAPWIGLIADEIHFGPISISHVSIHHGDKLAVVAPEETLHGSLKYRIDAEELKSMHRYHLVVGIHGEGSQDCITHTLGVWDSKGKGNFTLTAPKHPGIYQVRFLLVEGLTCSHAQNLWNSGEKEPSSAATIGVIIVE